MSITEAVALWIKASADRLASLPSCRHKWFLDDTCNVYTDRKIVKKHCVYICSRCGEIKIIELTI